MISDTLIMRFKSAWGDQGMSTTAVPRIKEVLPVDAWAILQTERGAAVLVDVRTKAEWAFVGLPDLTAIGQDLACVEWQSWPDISPNPSFTSELRERLGDREVTTLLFICRSGVRSMRAAEAVSSASATAGGMVACVNVATGFEGDLCGNGQRGRLTGWKAAGLPWRQS